MDWDSFTPMSYPVITLPGYDAPLAAPKASAPDLFDMPAHQRVLLDPATGKKSGGFTRTGVYLTVVR